MSETIFDDSVSRREAAEYIAEMTSQLAKMAGAQQFAVLRYLLDMARQEAHVLAHTQEHEDE